MINTPPAMRNERNRVAALTSYNLDYKNLGTNLNELALLAAGIAGMNISQVNLIDEHTQWTVAHFGSQLAQIDRKKAVCNYTIKERDGLEIRDLSTDKRFSERSFVTNSGLRHYYGVPLKTEDGYSLGALCVLHPHTKQISSPKKRLIRLIGKEIITRLDILRQIDRLKNTDSILSNAKKAVVNHLLIEPASYRLNYDLNNTARYDSVELINLYQIKDRLIRLFTHRTKSKAIGFDIGLSDRTATFLFPKEGLMQITGNLVSNAINYTPIGGKISVDLELITSEKGKTLNITVTDTGSGLDTQAIRFIAKGSNKLTAYSETKLEYGFGLGLVKELVCGRYGKLYLSSEKNVGSTIEISIPL